MTSFFEFKYKKQVLSTVSTLFVLLAIPLTVYTVLHIREYRTPAKTDTKPKISKELKIAQVKDSTLFLEEASKFLNDKNPQRVNLEKDLVKVTKERSDYLSELFEEDPATAKKLLLAEPSKLNFKKVKNINIEEKVTLSGHFLHSHSHGANFSQVEHWYELLTQEKIYKIFGESLPSYLENGQVEVTGFKLGEKVLVSSISKKGKKVLGVTTGPMKIAVIGVNHPDSPATFNMDLLKSKFISNPGTDVISYFSEASYGKLTMTPSFFGPYNLSSKNCLAGVNYTDIFPLANADINFLEYDRFIIVSNCFTSGSGGHTSLGTHPINTPDGSIQDVAVVYVYSFNVSPDVVVHELGHNFYFEHSAGYYCAPEVFIPPSRFDTAVCDISSDRFSPMSYSDDLGHFLSYHKNKVGWFDAGNYQKISLPGTYNFKVLPVERQNSGTLGLEIKRGGSNTYWNVDFRQPIGFDSWITGTDCPGCNMHQGASIRLIDENVYSFEQSDSLLIDTTPNSRIDGSSRQDMWDAALLPGKAFTDSEFGIKIETLSADATGVNVRVTVPSQSCIRSTPTFTPQVTSKTVSAPIAQDFIFTLKNNNSAGCVTERFQLSEGDSHEFDQYFSQRFVDLGSGQTTNVTLKIIPKGTIKSGTYKSGIQPAITSLNPNSIDIPIVNGPTINYILSSPSDSQPPSVPSNLRVTPLGARTVKLEWAASSDNLEVTGYTFTINGADWYLPTGTTSALHNSLQPNTTYSFSVKAYDRKGNYSSPSNSVTLTTASKTDLVSPSLTPNVKIKQNSANSVTLSWNAASDNVGVVGYRVAIDNKDIGGHLITSNSIDLNYLDHNKHYKVNVVAFDGSLNAAPYNNDADFTTAIAGSMPPSRPKALSTITVSTSEISISWGPSSSAYGISHYNIYRAGRWVGMTNSTSFIDRNLEAGRPKQYTVEAADNIGNFSPPSHGITGYARSTAGTDTAAPTLNVTVPTEGVNFPGGNITFSANASDNMGLNSVNYGLNGQFLARYTSTTSSPFTHTWNSVPGDHTFSVLVLDGQSNAVSRNIDFTVGGSILGDLDNDGDVDIFDLGALIGLWGSNNTGGDMSKNGRVDIYDLSILLTNWGN